MLITTKHHFTYEQWDLKWLLLDEIQPIYKCKPI